MDSDTTRLAIIEGRYGSNEAVMRVAVGARKTRLIDALLHNNNTAGVLDDGGDAVVQTVDGVVVECQRRRVAHGAPHGNTPTGS